jgi:F-type H+-transporting ATPase subunit b
MTPQPLPTEEAHAETVQQTAAEHAGPLGTLGINAPLFIAQLVNVAIILIVLRLWVFKPLAKVLEERREKIEKGLKHAKEADERLKTAKEHEEAVHAAARKEARTIIDEARAIGEKARAEEVAAAKQDIEQQTAEAKAKIAVERGHALEAVRKEVATLVLSATRKISSAEMDEKAHRTAIEQSMKELENA